jgi:phosphonoacetate hydrolase
MKSTPTVRDPVIVNGVSYRWPDQPTVVVCIDGGDPAYLRHGVAAGCIPNIASFIQRGFSTIADGTMPSFTCPNNMSIITGAPASRHGISGNFYLDARSGEAVVMTGPELLCADTILARFSRAGAKVVSITAKDKLCKQLGKGLNVGAGSVNFSSERADRCNLAEHGIENVLDFVGMPLPDIYSAELSLFVLAAAVKILERERPDLMFLSLTDYIQHKHAPEDAAAMEFYRAIDEQFGCLAELGALVALTADHGMNDKSQLDGRPNVIWLQDLLDEAFGAGDTKVICPITDYFVAHHGALGGFVRVWCQGEATADDVIDVIQTLNGIESVLDRDTVCRLYDLPPDREGDVAVIARSDVCIGSARADHDLSQLNGSRLRSHGSLAEAKVPFILSAPLNHQYRLIAGTETLKSLQIFDFALNGTVD